MPPLRAVEPDRVLLRLPALPEACELERGSALMNIMAHEITGDRIIDPMIDLSGCAKTDRVLIAGSKALEFVLEMQRRGFDRTAASANCGRAAGQYDVAMVDWRRRTIRSLDPTLKWLLGYLRPTGKLVVWVDAQKEIANQNLRAMLEHRGFAVEAGTDHDCGLGISARLLATHPLKKAA
jgi:acetolactate synthase regulatory subunit